MTRKIVVKHIRLGRIEEMEEKLKGWYYFDNFLTVN